MRTSMSWYQTLAWKFFLRQAATILLLIAVMLGVAYHQAARGARIAAGASLSSGSQVLAKAFEQEGRVLDAGLEVFTQYSGNVAIIEQALESGSAGSLADSGAPPRRSQASLSLPIGSTISTSAANPPGPAPTCSGRTPSSTSRPSRGGSVKP